MKLTVLVPSEQYRSSAGARIRYGRMIQGLAAVDVAMRLESIEHFDPSTSDCDALLISKCHDARGLIAAAVMSRRGKLVGVDLFDDYFSQTEDSRLIRYREWLSELLKDCSFCLCSTDAMTKVVADYEPDLPTHVVNDPAREHDLEEVQRLGDRKLREAVRDGIIRVAWFGVGDNPYFPVGLTDLFSHAAVLQELGCGGIAVELSVVTNRRALTADGLEMLSRLPVPATAIEWSEEAEQEVLERSLLAFLPVASQPFSTAKSLNRAITALSYGCQILSVGHPLYAALDPLIYRDAGEFLVHVEQGKLRHSSERWDIYLEKLKALGSAETEVSRLADFLMSLTPNPASSGVPVCLVHGLSTRAEAHLLIKAVGGLSIASPYCSANLDFDVHFHGLPPRMRMSVARRASIKAVAGASRTEPSLAPSSKGSERRLDQLLLAQAGTGTKAPLAYQLATYARSMAEIDRRLTEYFGPVRVIISETSRLPVSSARER